MQDKDSSLIKEKKKMFDRIQQGSLDFGPRLLFVKRFVYSSVSLISSTMSSFIWVNSDFLFFLEICLVIPVFLGIC